MTKVKIDFVVPGFSKCGSTTFCQLLSQHPDIFLPSIKEPWYFSQDDYESRKGYYENLYAESRPHQLRCDGSTSYSSYLSATISAERLKRNNPDCKFIFIARNPRARIESAYREMHHSGIDFGLDAPYSLSETFEKAPGVFLDALFWARIQVYREVFGDEHILVVFLEHLLSDQESVLRKCFAHLGLDTGKIGEIKTPNLNKGKEKLRDTRLLKLLRNNPHTGFKIAKIPPKTQNKIFKAVGLRKPFGKKPIPWDEKAEAYYREKVVPDSLKFLKFYGQPPVLWGLEEYSKQLHKK